MPGQSLARGARAYPLSTAEVAVLTRATGRQLQWWDEKGIINPVHKGHAREWGRADVLAVLLLLELGARGIGRLARRRILQRFMTAESDNRGKAVNWIVAEPNGGTFMHFSDQDALATSARARLCLLVDVERLREKLP